MQKTVEAEINVDGTVTLLEPIEVKVKTRARVIIMDEESNETKWQNREAILELAGSWNEMSETDFAEYLSEAKRSGGEMFDRDVTL